MGEKWHRVMQNLFSDQSEEEEEEVDSEHESNPHPNSALLSAETSTGLIKEGSTILPKHFRTNNEMAQLRAGKSSKSKLTIVKFRTSELVDGWESSFVRGLTFRMWLLLSMMEEWMPSSNSLSREMLFSLDMFSPDEGTKAKSSFPKTNSCVKENSLESSNCMSELVELILDTTKQSNLLESKGAKPSNDPFGNVEENSFRHFLYSGQEKTQASEVN